MGISYLGLKAVGRITATLINLSLYLIPLISLMLSSISIVGEKESGITEWIFSEPIGVLEYILGKFIGLVSAISIATLLGFGLASWLITSILPPEDISKYLYFIVIAVLLSSTSVGIGLLISVVTKSRLEALGLTFFTWFTMIFIYDMIVMGLAIAMNLKEQIVFFIAVLNPVETSRIMMIYSIDPALVFLGPSGIYTARTLGIYLPIVLTSIMITYVFISLTTAYLLFKRGDKI
jgi:ABC-type transport system involved in multi-copper enzyme maturation permease subunit